MGPSGGRLTHCRWVSFYMGETTNFGTLSPPQHMSNLKILKWVLRHDYDPNIDPKIWLVTCNSCAKKYPTNFLYQTILLTA